MNYFGIRVCLVSLVFASPAMAPRSEYVLGGDRGNPWLSSLVENPGYYVVFDNDGQPIDSVAVAQAPQGVGVDTLIDYSGGGIQSVWIEPTWNLARRLDLADGRITSSEQYGYLYAELESIVLSFDGNPKTATERSFVQDPFGLPGIGEGFRENIIVDLGADFPINRVRFYPRLGDDDARIIEQMAEPKPPRSAFGTESFSENYLEWYELSVADNSKPFSIDPTPTSFRLGTRWFKSTQRWGATLDPWFTSLIHTTENLDVVVDHRFPLRHERYVAVRPINPLRNWEIAEMEVYGEGYTRKGVFLTNILDFGQAVSWGKIRWEGELPPDTKVDIRTRTGNDAHPNLYWQRNNITDRLDQISLEEWKRIRGDSRLDPTYDSENWSFWSPPYDFGSGLRDPSTPADSWDDGMPLQSPSPSRYLQLQILLESTRNATPRLEALWIQFSQSPAASRLVGEIWPIEVNSFKPHSFTYVIRPDFAEGDNGFDRLEILTYTTVDEVHSVKVDSREIDLAAFPPEIQPDRITVKLDRKLQDPNNDRLKQVEVNFEAAVLRFGAEFKGWVFNSDDPDRLKQQIEPGNATFRFAGDVLSVRTVVGGDLLVFTEAFPNPFTPNGDGINDQFSLSFKVREVAVRRAMQVEIYDLAGNWVRTLSNTEATTGAYSFTWDGSNGEGSRVSPGLYLYRIKLQSDENMQEKLGSLAVAY